MRTPCPQFGSSPDSGRPPVEQSPRPIPAPGGRPDTTAPVGLRAPGPPLISADAAASALQELFLTNADRGDNAANDELVAELVRRIRAQRASRAGGS
ncbi:MAG: hypothetical protein ACRDTH_12985 [Pseudonocardiaceae bacterium]